jgi:hypothetical protein
MVGGMSTSRVFPIVLVLVVVLVLDSPSSPRPSHPSCLTGGPGASIIKVAAGVIRGAPMPVDITIKNVPDDLVAKLRRRAAEHNRTLNEEIIEILRAALCPPAQDHLGAGSG